MTIESFRVLVMGLPGSGKTTLAKQLSRLLRTATHLNADEVRKEADDWDFSEAGRVRQAERMKAKSEEVGGLVVADFVCPTPETRAAFDPHLVILMETIEAGRFEDTNRVFVRPANPDFVITGFGYTEQDVTHLDAVISECRPQGVMIGRFQPFHDGHKALLDKVIEKHGYCTIMVRTVPVSQSNPIGVSGVFQGIREVLDKEPEKYLGRYSMQRVPNVAGVYYGRGVGYNVEQIDLGAEIHAISATAIRKERGIGFNRENVQ